MGLVEPAPEEQPFGLPAYVVEKLRGVFKAHSGVRGVILYGSRDIGTFRHSSDIDLALDAPDLPWSEFNLISLDIDELLLPWKVDLALLHQIENRELIAHIQKVGIPFYS